MSDELSTRRPRASSARLLYESSRRHNRYLALGYMQLFLTALNVYAGLNSPYGGTGWTVGWSIGLIASAAIVWTARHRRGRLEDVWRAGELIEVTMTSREPLQLTWQAFRCTVEYDSRTARVILADYPPPGTKLRALIAGSWVLVEDVIGGRLRLGHLAKPNASGPLPGARVGGG